MIIFIKFNPMKKLIPFSLFLFFWIVIVYSQGQPTTGIRLKTVLFFGAVGDSATDDTEAVQKAVDSGIGQIVFPSGVYRLTKPVEINLNETGYINITGGGTARIIMDGVGPAFRFTGTHSGNASPSGVKQNVWANQRMPMVDDLEINGIHPESLGIEATGTMQLTITRVLIRNVLYGIRLFNLNRNVIISACHIYNNRGIGIYLDNVNLHQINIVGSHISYNGGGGVVVRNGNVRNLQIGNCDIESNMSYNWPKTANVFIDMPEGSMREGAITGCTIQHDHNVEGSANIRFVGHGVNSRGKAGNFTIGNNVLSDTRNNIHIKYGRGIIISGNTFWRGYDHNILIEQSEHIVLGTNLMDRNPDYGEDSNNNIKFFESNNISINGLHLVNSVGGEAGIVMEQCRNYNLVNSTILDCDNGGILLKETGYGRVAGNFIRDERLLVKNPVAIKVVGGSNNLVRDNYTNGLINGKRANSTITGNDFLKKAIE
jgi:parallel beta-helix repeat protein